MKILQRILSALSVLTVCCFASHTYANNYNWDAVAMGGGGFVNAVIPSKTEQHLFYARTDVGGAYRWDNNRSRWVALTDWVSQEQIGFLGVESIALDSKDSAKLYMLVGISYFNGGKTAILKSNDYGNTFTVIDVSNQFKAHGNGMGRQTGEKLVVDPLNSEILYTGSRWNGLFKSTDAGVTWSRLSSLNVTTTPNENGISFVVLDPASEQGAAAKNVFVGVSRFPSVGPNFYYSADAGQSFTVVNGGPTNLMPQRAVFDARGDLLITYANGAGPHGRQDQPEPMDQGQVWKYSPANQLWINITPAGFASAFGGVTVDPNDSNHIIVSSCGTYQFQYESVFGNAWGDQVFSTRDGGKNWTNLIKNGFSLDNQNIDWIVGHAIHWAGSVEFDPFNTKNIYITSGNGIFKAQDVDASPVVWSFWVKGIEETVPLDLVSIPNGPLVSVIGDYDGFVHTDVTKYAAIHTPRMGTSTSVTFAYNDPQFIVRVGNSLYYSADTGATWNKMNFANGIKGHATLTADGKTLVYSPGSTPDNKEILLSYYTKDWGQTWTVIQGLSMSGARIVADTVNSQKLYALNGNKLMVSIDSGVSFQQMGTLPHANGSKLIRAVPGVEGGVWVALSSNGLAQSSDSGANFTLVPGVSAAQAIGFGKAAEGSDFPAIYIWGTVNNQTGIFVSTDRGNTWTRINDSAHQYGGPGNGNFIIGDMNTFGTVYMSTAGRGIVYGKLNSTDSSSASSASSAFTTSSSVSSSPVTSSSSVASSLSSVSSSVSSIATSSAPVSGGSSGGGSVKMLELLCLFAFFCALRIRRLS
ncbi:MAG TPA: xyloglucanase [Cellvibrio sp.]|nr:xyloglucanase [Cellvibrio sp.]